MVSVEARSASAASAASFAWWPPGARRKSMTAESLSKPSKTGEISTHCCKAAVDSGRFKKSGHSFSS